LPFQKISIKLKILLSPAGTEQVTLEKKEPSCIQKTEEPESIRIRSNILAVYQFLDRQGDDVLKKVFDKFAELEISPANETIHKSASKDDGAMSESKLTHEAFIRTDGLQNALLELGVPMEKEKVKDLMVAMDLDENGGLDFEEFKRAVQQPPTQLEQWASMLPLAGMLAKSLPVSSWQGDQPLRDFSRFCDDEIDATVDAFSEGLRRLLIKARATATRMFDSVDKKASEAAKESASGASAVSKFTTFKMSTGNVSEYFEGLSSRIGTLLRPFVNDILAASCNGIVDYHF
jgi:hypothetical protein